MAQQALTGSRQSTNISLIVSIMSTRSAAIDDDGFKESGIIELERMIKDFQSFFNEKGFHDLSPRGFAELQQAVHDFLSDYKGPGRLLESYNIMCIRQDPETMGIDIKVGVKPFFATGHFLIELTSHNGTADVD